MCTPAPLTITVADVSQLRFTDGAPVRAASGITRFGDGWLVVQDDATHAASWVGGALTPLRVFEPVEDLDHFSEAAGTKHLKPDLEAACPLPDGGALLLGSGSLPARRRGALVRGAGHEGAEVVTADLAPLYASVADVLGVGEDLNLEGACIVGDTLRWFHRGAATTPSASIDVPAGALRAVFDGARDPATIHPTDPREYHLGAIGGVGLSVTDAITLPDGRVLVALTAEDTPNAVDDGPVAGSALAVLSGTCVDAFGLVPAEAPWKIEGLAVERLDATDLRLVAVVDQDDPDIPSTALSLRVHLAPGQG